MIAGAFPAVADDRTPCRACWSEGGACARRRAPCGLGSECRGRPCGRVPGDWKAMVNFRHRDSPCRPVNPDPCDPSAPDSTRNRQFSNTKMVGGPGFEPGASRSGTVSAPCPRVSWRLLWGPPEFWPSCPSVTSRNRPFPGMRDTAVIRRRPDQPQSRARNPLPGSRDPPLTAGSTAGRRHPTKTV